MATLYIAEFLEVLNNGGVVQVARTPVVQEQTVAVGGSSTQSSAFKGCLIRVHTDVICSISIGSNPTATATTARMAADSTEYFAVKPGDKIAVITNS